MGPKKIPMTEMAIASPIRDGTNHTTNSRLEEDWRIRYEYLADLE